MPNYCPRCGNLKPYKNQICAKCDQCDYPDKSITSEKFPPYDKHGFPIFLIPIDVAKSHARENYIRNTEVSKDFKFLTGKYTNIVKHKERTKTPKIITGVFLIVLSIVFMYVYIFAQKFDLPALSIIGFLCFISFPIIGIIIIINSCKNPISYKDKIKMTLLSVNQVKESYYYNANVIGYCCYSNPFSKISFSIAGSNTFFAETDRKNIKYITYDTEHAEYILHLHNPIYINPNLSKTHEMRIQDIFDDDLLSQIFNCSLPPKRMMF